MESIQAPPQWPTEVIDLYEPLRELGRGGFASVILARNKKSGDLHAIKVAGSKMTTREELGYALREIDILAETNHHGIMKLIQHWEPPVGARMCAAVMALSYAEGPTLEKLLRLEGKLSFSFCRVVAAQLVDAVEYLHGRAVVHRDIKPDNIVITGAHQSQDEIWDDDVSRDETEDWSFLRKKWHLTLIDFGFARALTPDDYEKADPRTPVISMEDVSTHSLNRSRHFTRKMSALGNRQYAAPEIINGVQSTSDFSVHQSSCMHPIDVTKTLSSHVSYYGLMADAYSIGNTIKYMITGVNPGENVNDVIAFENNPLILFCRLFCRLFHEKSSDTRQVQYRRLSRIPKEIARLITDMTHPDPRKRLSVRRARLHPWIDAVLEGCSAPRDAQQKPDYLSFVLPKNDVDKEM